MKIYYDIIQRSRDWLDLKWGKLSGTGADSILKLSTVGGFSLDKSAQEIGIRNTVIYDDLFSQKTEGVEYEDNFITDDMRRGIEMEPEAIKELINETGIDFIEAGFIQRTATHGHSPDSISRCEKFGAEVKCFGRKLHAWCIRNNAIPRKHLAQCVNMFACVDTLEKLYFVAYRPENKIMPLFIKVITRDTLIPAGKKDYTVGRLAEILIDRVDEVELNIEDDIKAMEDLKELNTEF